MAKSSRRLNADMLWLTSGHLLSAAAMLAMTKVWAVYLEPAEFGFMALVIGTASMLFAIVMGPLFQALLVGYIKHLQNGNGYDYRTVTSGLVRVRLAIIVVLILAVGGLFAWYWGLHWATPILVIGLIIVDTIRTFEQRLFAAARRQREVAIITAGDVLFRVVFVLVFLNIYEANAYVAMAGNLAGAALFAATIHMTFRLESRSGTSLVSDKFQRTIADETSQLARPLLPSLFLANLTETGNRYIISAIVGLQTAGLFFAGYGFVRRPYGMLSNVGDMTMTPILKAAIEKGGGYEVERVRYRWLVFIVIFSFLGAVLFFILRDPLVILLLSEKYIGVADMLFGLAIAIALFSVANVFNWFSMTLGNSHAVLINNLVGSAVTTVLTIVLCFTIGVIGAVWALIIGYGFQLLASIITFGSVRKQHASNMLNSEI